MTADEKVAYGRELTRQYEASKTLPQTAFVAAHIDRIQQELKKVYDSIAPTGVLPPGFSSTSSIQNGRELVKFKAPKPLSVLNAPEPAPQGILGTLGNLFSGNKSNKGMVGQYKPNEITNSSQLLLPSKANKWFGGKSRSHRRRRNNKTKGRRKH